MKDGKLSQLDYTFLMDNGFFQVSNIIPDEKIEIADKMIEVNNVPTSREDAGLWIKEKSSYQKKKEVLDLHNEYVKPFVETSLFGEGKTKKVKSCQIAYRFPGEGAEENNQYHIDNFTDKDLNRHRIPPEFSVIVGVCLSDTTDDNQGNFTVFPWSQYTIAEYCKEKGYEYLADNGLNEMTNTLKFDNEFQIKAKKGDIIIASRYLGHYICAPNKSENIRKIIWYRVILEEEFNEVNFGDVWYGFDVLKKEMGFDKITEVGPRHYKINDKTRIRVGRLPNFFSATATLYDDCGVSSNGFISKNMHLKLKDKLLSMQPEERIKYLESIDYGKFIEEVLPYDKDKVLNYKDKEMYDMVYFQLKKFHSQSKEGIVRGWLSELMEIDPNIEFEIMKGRPGALIVMGNPEIVDIIRRRFKAFHWKHIKEIDNKKITDYMINTYSVDTDID